MDWKILASSVVLGGALMATGCGSDDPASTSAGTTETATTETATTESSTSLGLTTSGGGVDGCSTDNPGDFATPACDSGPGDEAAITYAVTDIEIPGPAADGTVVGFNLDCHITLDPADPVGEGKLDDTNGTDNALAGLVPALSGLGVDLNAEIAGGLVGEGGAEPELTLDVIVTGWNGTDTDDCVSVQIEVNGEAVSETAINATVSGGELQAAIGTLPLSIPYDGAVLELDVTSAVASLPITSGALTDGVIAGVVDYEGSLQGVIMDVIASLGEVTIDFATINNIITGILDFRTAGASEADALTVGIQVSAAAE